MTTRVFAWILLQEHSGCSPTAPGCSHKLCNDVKSYLFCLLLLTNHFWSVLTPEATEFFESNIRPIFAQECDECHRAGGKMEGGLALDFRQALLDGGDSGPVYDSGKPSSSLLIQVIKRGDNNIRSGFWSIK